MRFTITGADKDSGDDINVVVNAVTRIEAEHIAHTRGILVAAIIPLDKDADEGPITLDDDPFEAPPAAAPVASQNGNGDAAHPPSEAPHAHITSIDQGSFGSNTHQGDHIEYKVVHNPSVMLLTIAVNTMIRDGWELQGGVSTCIINNAPNFFQAVIKHPPKK